MSGARILQGAREALAIARRENGRRVLVTGGRDYADAAALWAVLDEEHARDPISLIIEGGQRTFDRNKGLMVGGADYWGQQWAKARRVAVLTIRADWSNTDRPGAVVRRDRQGRLYDAAAGPERNRKMLEHGPALVVAAPGGDGTADMVSQARAASIPVREVGRDQGEG